MSHNDDFFRNYHEFMAGHPDADLSAYHAAEAVGALADDAYWDTTANEPPAECYDDTGAFRGDPGWENRWETYRSATDEGRAR